MTITEEATLPGARSVEISTDATPTNAGIVFLDVPCQHSEDGRGHVFALDRAALLRALEQELGLADPLEELWRRS